MLTYNVAINKMTQPAAGHIMVNTYTATEWTQPQLLCVVSIIQHSHMLPQPYAPSTPLTRVQMVYLYTETVTS